MADQKISALNALVTWDDDDEFAIVDTDVVETKRMTAINVKANVQRGFLNLEPTAETIDAAGAIVATSSYVVLDTFGGAATDNLDDINGAVVAGDIIILRTTVDARDVVIRDSAGNLRTSDGANYTLGDNKHTITFIYNGANWIMVSSAPAIV